MSAYRVVLADSHVMFRQLIKTIFQDMADYEVTGDVGDGPDLLGLLQSKESVPDLIILDISLPRLQGPTAVRRIKMIQPGVKILIMGLDKHKQYFNYAVSMGAEGYFVKTDAYDELVLAIEKIRQGGVYVPPFISSSADCSDRSDLENGSKPLAPDAVTPHGAPNRPDR